MNLSKSQKIIVETEVQNRIGSTRVPTKTVIVDVLNRVSIPGCRACNVSGVISGMNKRGIIICRGGFCWWFNLQLKNKHKLFKRYIRFASLVYLIFYDFSEGIDIYSRYLNISDGNIPPPLYMKEICYNVWSISEGI